MKHWRLMSPGERVIFYGVNAAIGGFAGKFLGPWVGVIAGLAASYIAEDRPSQEARAELDLQIDEAPEGWLAGYREDGEILLGLDNVEIPNYVRVPAAAAALPGSLVVAAIRQVRGQDLPGRGLPIPSA